MAKTNTQRIQDLETDFQGLAKAFGEVSHIVGRVHDVEHSVADLRATTVASTADLRAKVESFGTTLGDLSARFELLMSMFGTSLQQADVPCNRVPEPTTFGGVRDAKELENFIFDMEQYFLATRAKECDRVRMATMYLSGDAKLWWRTRYIDVQQGNATIDTWEHLKVELRGQFLPENVAYNARKSLRDLRQKGSVRDYVKRFCTLMLDICDMSEKDKLFYFLEGLKPWARTELNRQRVKDLASAQAAAECLMDYDDVGGWERDAESVDHGQAEWPSKHGFSKSGKSDRSSSVSRAGSSRGKDLGSTWGTESRTSRRTVSCYMCNGPHKVAECPNIKAINALRAKLSGTGLGSVDGGSGSSDEERSSHGGQPRMGSARRLSAVQQRSKGEHRPGGLPRSVGHELMFVDMRVNGRPIRALVDTGATHNFIAGTEVSRLGLKLERNLARVKAVNSRAQPIQGVAKRVHVKLGSFKGKLNFNVIPMDDFQAVLGLEFFRETDSVVAPKTGRICMMGDKPHVVSTMSKRASERVCSTLQLQRDGLKHGRLAYLAAMTGSGDMESSLTQGGLGSQRSRVNCAEKLRPGVDGFGCQRGHLPVGEVPDWNQGCQRGRLPGGKAPDWNLTCTLPICVSCASSEEDPHSACLDGMTRAHSHATDVESCAQDRVDACGHVGRWWHNRLAAGVVKVLGGVAQVCLEFGFGDWSVDHVALRGVILKRPAPTCPGYVPLLSLRAEARDGSFGGGQVSCGRPSAGEHWVAILPCHGGDLVRAAGAHSRRASLASKWGSPHVAGRFVARPKVQRCLFLVDSVQSFQNSQVSSEDKLITPGDNKTWFLGGDCGSLTPFSDCSGYLVTYGEQLGCLRVLLLGGQLGCSRALIMGRGNRTWDPGERMHWVRLHLH